MEKEAGHGIAGMKSKAPGKIAGIDRLIHEPARLDITAQLYVVDRMDFLFLMRRTGLTFGNLSSHLAKLEKANYVEVNKGFEGKKQRTMLRLSEKGRKAFESYREKMKQVLEKPPR